MALLTIQDLGPKTKERLKGLKTEIGFYHNSLIFWESISENEKTLLRKSFDNQKHHPRNKTLPHASPLQMWAFLNKEPEIVGVIQVACQMEIITRSEREELLQRIGHYATSGKVEIKKKLAKENKPFWNHREGKLYFRHEVIIKTQRRTNPSGIQIILQAFQNEGWPDEIKTPPLPDGYGLADAVYDLNYKTNEIKISVVAGGNYLSWVAIKNKM